MKFVPCRTSVGGKRCPATPLFAHLRGNFQMLETPAALGAATNKTRRVPYPRRKGETYGTADDNEYSRPRPAGADHIPQHAHDHRRGAGGLHPRFGAVHGARREDLSGDPAGDRYGQPGGEGPVHRGHHLGDPADPADLRADHPGADGGQEPGEAAAAVAADPLSPGQRGAHRGEARPLLRGPAGGPFAPDLRQHPRLQRDGPPVQ